MPYLKCLKVSSKDIIHNNWLSFWSQLDQTRFQYLINDDLLYALTPLGKEYSDIICPQLEELECDSSILTNITESILNDFPVTGRMVGGESAGSTAYSGSPEPLESHSQQHQVLAPVPVTPTPMMFDSTWSYEHLQQQQVDNDIYAQQGYMGYEAESYGGQEASQVFESLWRAPAVGFEYQDVHV
ncbi:hypothetical protein BDQ17DRAFT_1441251 [Cyathus striatus]|nr:hypothetical protein BDQ17DRAFT_1441251 [Cyathus striatus]